jgi:membrane protease YdiL (CAAX protease family)
MEHPSPAVDIATSQENPIETPKVWGAGLTWVFSISLLLIFAVIQSAVFIFAAIPILNERHPDGFNALKMVTDTESELYTLQTHGGVISWVSICSGILTALLILLVIKLKRGSTIKHYLALRAPAIKQIALWLGVMILLIVSLEFLTVNVESFESSFMSDIILTTTSLPILFLGIGIIGPIFEEILFRGFMFKGLETAWGGHAAVWITTFIFTTIHMQYSLEVLLLLFPLGLMMGYSRMISGSLWVPILLHIVNNCAAIALTAYYYS